MLTLQSVTYAHPNRDVLFNDLNLAINKQDKIALIGNNGTGKSTLLKIMAGELKPSSGSVQTNAKPYYVPQLFGQYNDQTVAQALGIADKLTALNQILAGHVTGENMAVLDDDWTIEDRCREALAHWGLQDIDLFLTVGHLSGGQKTKVFLSGIMIHQPAVVLLDEPSNHLDVQSRKILYDYIKNANNTLVIVSHDKALLNLLDLVCELNKHGIVKYGGNYNFYAGQKAAAQEALSLDVKSKEKALRKAKETARETLERQQKLDARGKRKQEKAGLPAIVINTLKNNAERSTAHSKEIHAEKVSDITNSLAQLRKELPDIDKMKMGFNNSPAHRGKLLFSAKSINFSYIKKCLWEKDLSLQIKSGECVVLNGLNGSGKTTLIKIILDQLQPRYGNIERANFSAIYIDQDYSLIDNNLTVYQQAQQFNSGILQEHDIKIRLTRFLFTGEYWDKSCSALSGGEKMRLMLCCLTIGNQSPDMIVLDEPTNNLDIQNVEILIAAINEYRGTLLVVCHDEYFLQQIKVDHSINLG